MRGAHFNLFFIFLWTKKCEAAGKKCEAGRLTDYIPGETLIVPILDGLTYSLDTSSYILTEYFD